MAFSQVGQPVSLGYAATHISATVAGTALGTLFVNLDGAMKATGVEAAAQIAKATMAGGGYRHQGLQASHAHWRVPPGDVRNARTAKLASRTKHFTAEVMALLNSMRQNPDFTDYSPRVASSGRLHFDGYSNAYDKGHTDLIRLYVPVEGITEATLLDSGLHSVESDHGVCGGCNVNFAKWFGKAAANAGMPGIQSSLRAMGAVRRTFSKKILGASDLFVVDLMVDQRLRMSLNEKARQFLGSEEKKVAQFHAMRVFTIIDQHLRKERKGVQLAPDDSKLFFDAHTLLFLCCLMNYSLGTTVQFVHVLKPAELPVEVLEPVDPFKSSHDTAHDGHDDLVKAQELLPQLGGDVVVAAPATAVVGELYTPSEGMSVMLMEEALDERDAKLMAKGWTPGAHKTGVNLFGTPAPLDPHDIDTVYSGLTRHVSKVKKQITKADGTPDIVQFSKAPEMPWSPLRQKVWDDLVKRDMALLQTTMEEGFQAPEEWKHPGSLSTDEADQKLADLFMEVTDTAGFGRAMGKAAKVLNVPFLMKAGEADTRGRIVNNVGSDHQVLASPIITAIERLHKVKHNHHNVKGLTTSGLRLDLQDFLAHLPDDFAVLSFDKHANDRTWTYRDCEAFMEYVYKVASVLCSGHVDGALLGSELFQLPTWYKAPPGLKDTERRILMVHQFVRVLLKPLLWYLLSGLNWTSLGNRMQSDVEVGCLVHHLHGAKAYDLWLKQLYNPVPSDLPYGVEDFPALADGVVKMKHNSAIASPARHKSEGDDLVLAIQVPGLAEIPVKDTAARNKAIHQYQDRITDFAKKELHIAYEAPTIPDPGCHVGKNAIIEFLSSVSFLDKSTNKLVMTPKPIKSFGKAAWEKTRQATYTQMKDESWVVLKDEKYFRMSATRYLALAELAYQAPGLRQFHMNHAKLAISNLFSMGKREAMPAYWDRALQTRGFEEAPPETRSLYEWYTALEEKMKNTPLSKEQLLLSAMAYKMEEPQLLQSASTKELVDRLRELDVVMQQVPITQEMVDDPRVYLAEIGETMLDPIIASRTQQQASKDRVRAKAMDLANPTRETDVRLRVEAGVKGVKAKNNNNPQSQGSSGPAKSAGKGKGGSVRYPGRTPAAHKGKGKGAGAGKGSSGNTAALRRGKS
jgi:hypothetical protein